MVKNKSITIAIVCILAAMVSLVLIGCEEDHPTTPGSYGNRDINTFKYLGELVTEDDFRIAGAYDLLILNEAEAIPDKISRIRSYDPDLKIILYTMSEDLPNPTHPFFQENPDIHPSLQEMYLDIDQNHPEYFLLDNNDNRIYLTAYDDMYSEYYPDTEEKPGHCLDPRTGWADYYGQYVLDRIASGIYDGVYSDAARCYEEMKDEGITTRWQEDNGEDKWNYAVLEMLQKIENSLGPTAITIYNNGYNNWIDVYDGRLYEWFLASFEDYSSAGGDLWLLHMQSAKETVDSGKMLLACQYGRNAKDRMYGLTSFLLIANDNSYYFFNEHSVDEDTPWRWYPEYEVEIGDPSGDYYYADDVFQRDYTEARILVNPGSSSIEINLDESCFTLDGNSVSSVTIGAKNGIILFKEKP